MSPHSLNGSLNETGEEEEEEEVKSRKASMQLNLMYASEDNVASIDLSIHSSLKTLNNVTEAITIQTEQEPPNIIETVLIEEKTILESLTDLMDSKNLQTNSEKVDEILIEDDCVIATVNENTGKIIEPTINEQCDYTENSDKQMEQAENLKQSIEEENPIQNEIDDGTVIQEEIATSSQLEENIEEGTPLPVNFY